jgi:hypothetical protein
VAVNIEFYNELTLSTESIHIQPIVVDLDYDIVLGKETIHENDLVDKLRFQIFGPKKGVGVHKEIEPICSSAKEAVTSIPNLTVRSTADPWPLNTIVDKEHYFDTSDQEEIQQLHDLLDDFNLNRPVEDEANPEEIETVIPSDIHGTPELISKLKLLCRKYHKIFSREVKKTPARVPQMEIDVDPSWYTKCNRQHRRIMSHEKEKAVEEFVKKLLKLGVIRVSKSKNWSHPTLTRKSNGTWRLCIDFRLLNLLCSKSDYPIPHIDKLLERIGKANPKYFAVMDFVSGFYQCELLEESRSATAFMTHMGLFEWIRVPMGIKGAPTYFQEVMESVLSGLTRSICELYIDDCIVFGRDEE